MRTAEGASEKQSSLKARLRNGLTYLLTSPTTVCQSLKFLVVSICNLPDVVNLSVPRVRHSTFRTRAFYVAGPTLWNSLPDHLQDPAVDSKQFKRDLKTYLFAGYSS